MLKPSSILSFVISLVAAPLLLAASPVCAQNALDLVMANKLLKVAILIDSAAYGHVGTDMQPQGLDIDMAQLIAARLGVEVELLPVTSGNRIPYLRSAGRFFRHRSAASTAGSSAAGCCSRGSRNGPVPSRSWEASLAPALNLGEQLRHVIGPQALRVAVPPTVGFRVQVVNDTALASVIGFTDQGRDDDHQCHFSTVHRLRRAALMYFLRCHPVSARSKSLERKLHQPSLRSAA